jgi:hypothetical protein
MLPKFLPAHDQTMVHRIPNELANSSVKLTEINDGRLCRPIRVQHGHRHVQVDYENDREARQEDADGRRLGQKPPAVLRTVVASHFPAASRSGAATVQGGGDLYNARQALVADRFIVRISVC